MNPEQSEKPRTSKIRDRKGDFAVFFIFSQVPTRQCRKLAGDRVLHQPQCGGSGGGGVPKHDRRRVRRPQLCCRLPREQRALQQLRGLRVGRGFARSGAELHYDGHVRRAVRDARVPGIGAAALAAHRHHSVRLCLMCFVCSNWLLDVALNKCKLA